MLLRFSLLATLLVATSADDSVLPSCPAMTEETIPKYHHTCNRIAQNSPARRRQRRERHDRLEATKAYSLIPPQKTVVCPAEPLDLSSPVTGQDLRWIVENKASTPVVLAFLRDGMEYSATNPNVTPPQADERAILQPGEFKVLHTFEGHVFFARELLADGSTGDVLLQHRPGPIEFTNRFGQELDCGSDEVSEYYDDEEYYNDNEGESTNDSEHDQVVDFMNNQDSTTSTSNLRGQRSSSEMKRCNLVYQGFRNTLGGKCALDIYYAGFPDEGSSSDVALGPMQCDERVKMHLGTAHQNNAYQDESSLKYEAIFVGHQFVARLASNPDIVVDTFTLQPTQIHDCPRRQATPVAQEQVIEFNGIQNGHANLSQNATSGDGDATLSVVGGGASYRNVLSSLSS